MGETMDCRQRNIVQIYFKILDITIQDWLVDTCFIEKENFQQISQCVVTIHEYRIESLQIYAFVTDDASYMLHAH
jgi:hypothetical protein